MGWLKNIERERVCLCEREYELNDDIIVLCAWYIVSPVGTDGRPLARMRKRWEERNRVKRQKK